MDTVADIAGDALKADVQAIRTPEQAAAARAKVEGLLRRPLTRARRRADRAAQQSRPAGRLQRARHCRGRHGGGEPSAQPDLFAAAHFRLRRDRDRAPHRRRHTGARDACRARRDRRRSLSPGAAACRSRRRCASPPRRGAPFTARSRRARLVGFLEQAPPPPRPPMQLSKRLGESGAMNKLDQAREQVFYAEIDRAARDRAPARRGERERLIRALGLWGGDLAFRASGRSPGAAGPAAQRCRAVEMRGGARAASICRSARIELEALAKSYGLTHATRFRQPARSFRASRKTTATSRPAPRIIERGVERRQLQIPIFDFGEARAARGRARPTCRPSTG